VFKCESDGNG